MRPSESSTPAGTEWPSFWLPSPLLHRRLQRYAGRHLPGTGHGQCVSLDDRLRGGGLGGDLRNVGPPQPRTVGRDKMSASRKEMWQTPVLARGQPTFSMHPSSWRGCMKSPQTWASRLVMRRTMAA
jgi:hypothetical protein